MGGTKRQLDEEIELVRQRCEKYCETALEEYETKVKAIHADLVSRMRLSCSCKDMKRPILFPLTNRIVEMARERAV